MLLSSQGTRRSVLPDVVTGGIKRLDEEFHALYYVVLNVAAVHTAPGFRRRMMLSQGQCSPGSWW